MSTTMRSSSFFLSATAVTAALLATTAHAHGYVTTSRNKFCQDSRNVNCGNIAYEPQSLEAPKGFPDAGGPVDGQLASAGIAVFAELDEQSSTRWSKTAVQGGVAYDFTWHFTANHVTDKWEYYITRADWNPDAPLTRAQLDATPFCSFDGGHVQPPMTVTHSCPLPERTDGYHVVLAVWTIGDTVNAFYNAVDVEFGNGGSNPTTTTTVAPPTTTTTTTTTAPPPTTTPCGNGVRGNGYCNDGTCCSEWGWCGCTVDHCINGQSCNGPPSTSTTVPPPSSGTCGDGSVGNGLCADGSCCSAWGYCGCTADHCVNGQACTAGTCGGGSVGDGICADGSCCSEWGYCGCSADYCTRSGHSC